MAKICFIVGHGKSKSGGYDSGAVSKDGKYHEFKIAKEITRHAYNHFKANYGDCSIMNYEGNLYLSDRIKAANSAGFDFVAEIHLNAGGGTGTECFYSKLSNKGKQAAISISNSIAAAFGVRNRGAKTKTNSAGKDYFGIIRQTKATAVLVETLFIDSGDLYLLTTYEGQQKCGAAIADGIAEALGLAKKATAATTKPAADSYLVRVTANSLFIRAGAGLTFGIKGYVKKNEVYTITERQGNWGKLKSGAGWISLKYTQRL